MDDDLFSRDIDPEPGRRDSLFGWTVFILLLTGFALACWIGSYYLFGHPENPKSYEILKKLQKVEAPKRFELTQAPAGEFLTPKKLYERYGTLPSFELEKENRQLMRDFIGNYATTKRLVPYVIGRFNILDSYELKPTNAFPSGVVALAQGADFPQILIEHVYTAEPATVPLLQRMLLTGLDIKLEKTLDLSAVIHIARLPDGRLQITVVPLLYGSYAMKQGTGTFSLQPPSELNLVAGFPIIRGDFREEAFKTYASYRKKNVPSKLSERTPTPEQAEGQAAKEPALVRVEIPQVVSRPTPAPGATPVPAIAQATPVPVMTPLPLNTPPPTPVPTPAQVAAATPSPTLKTTAEATPTPIASPTPVAVAQGAPLKPFLASNPTPAPGTSTGASWRTFAPGQMPRGRLLEAPDANELVERGVSGERLYLRGNFTVTASGENRAVLRPHGGALSGLVRPGGSNTRIIAEFPAGSQPPQEGASVSRDQLRPFQITDVRRGADGQINVYVREITTP